MCRGLVLFLCLFLVPCGPIVECAKILGVFPFPSKSHYAMGNSLLKELAIRGHEVTMIAAFEETSLPPNVSYRTLKVNIDLNEGNKKINFFEQDMSNPYLITFFLNWAGSKITNGTFNAPEVQKLLRSREKFDAVIMDQFTDDSFAYFAHHFGANQILLLTTCANSWVNPLVANPAPPSVNPELLLEFSSSMTFLERLKNTVFYIFSELNRQLYFFPKQNEVIRTNFPKARPLYDYLYNVSLILMNAHESFNDPLALVPVMKNVGGMHVSPSGKLPSDLRKFMDEAKEGVVYFSMGSNLKSKDLPPRIRGSILKVFAKLDVKVLWKWEDETLPGQPGNVKLSKWLPQQEILGHPNLKVFITHGGLLSTIEAVHYGVPLLTLPVYGDQKLNAATAQQKGYAINIPFADFEEGKFEQALNELLRNPKYKQNAAIRSKLFHDRPMKPLDEAVYWVEYVIRHRGAEHLRVAALKLSWYQYILLDVFGFILVALSIVVYILRMILMKVCCGKPDKVKSKIN
ncbi:UDP-glycosyltransferase UGT5-like [Coccinella septempunctata]|uniref:UDP-glycosyltransferase UGT5-like n=1 Tax=Coccinella septempunctata TaxID=41139 RepID=UPI001D080B0C|nr:UDP-glycosyltransferase UGT5-like [Coccinella septempunctata]